MEASWKAVLKSEFRQDYFKALTDFVDVERRNFTVYPPAGEVFTAFDLTPYDKVRVVILGQDPYHGPGQAHGLAFSVKPGVPLPPSLKNIFKELHNDIGMQIPKNGTLTGWAKQGVLILNAILTVEESKPASH